MVLAAASVMSLGTWFLFRASRTAQGDANRVLSEFVSRRVGAGPAERAGG
jgi:hypothetical protein